MSASSGASGTRRSVPSSRHDDRFSTRILAGKAVGFGLPIAVVLAMRFIGLGHPPLWLDEANTVLIAWRDPRGVVAALAHDGNPPLFYWVLHGWMAIFGSSEAAVRSPSALPRAASVAAG